MTAGGVSTSDDVCYSKCCISHIPDSKVHWANMGPTRVLSAPDGPHVGPMNLAIWIVSKPCHQVLKQLYHFVNSGSCLCCQNACPLSAWTDGPKPNLRNFETLGDLKIRNLIRYWLCHYVHMVSETGMRFYPSYVAQCVWAGPSSMSDVAITLTSREQSVISVNRTSREQPVIGVNITTLNAGQQK